MAGRKVKFTCTLLFSTIIAIFGNSFLYGYNIGAVNNPAEVVRRFYARIILERAGLLHHHDDGSIDDNMTALQTTLSPVTIATFINSSSLSGNTSIADEEEIEKEVEEDPVLELLWAITVAIFVLFGMFGAFASSRVADHFGRKKGMILITVFMFIAGILGAIPKAINSFEVIIVHRAFVGLHCGLSMSLVSLYIAEIAPREIRGALGACHQLFITIGILSSNIIGVRQLTGNDRLWPFVFAFNAFPSFVCVICMPFCPESPRFLLINKKLEADARKAMQRLRGYDDVEDEMDEMKIEASKIQSVKAFSIKQLLVTPGLRLPTFIATMSMAAQQLSGINAVMSYSSFMFKNAGVPEDVIQWVVCGSSTVNTLATFICVWLIEKSGRRPLLIYPTILMILSFVFLTIFHNLQYVESLEDSHSAFAIIGIIAMHTYVIGFAIGLGPIPFLMAGELFRQEPRAAATGLCLATNWICNFILMLIFRFMQKSMKGFVYVPFIVVLVISLTFIILMVPETKNKTFEEIAASLSFGRKKKGKGKGYLTSDTNDNEEEMMKMNK